MKLYAMAEHRQAYAGWCARNGVKQNHAVFVRTLDQLQDLSLDHSQFIFVDGWERNKQRDQLLAAYGAATLNNRKDAA
jgi:hypothetical protein